MGCQGYWAGSWDRPHLLGDEGAGECDCRPEENAAAEDHFPVEAVAQVAKDGGSHHEAADKHCARRRELKGQVRFPVAEPTCPDYPNLRPSAQETKLSLGQALRKQPQRG